MISSIDSEVEQIDGRRAVVERHLLDSGGEALIAYMAESKQDSAKALADRAVLIGEIAAKHQADSDAAEVEFAIDSKLRVHAEKQADFVLQQTWGLTLAEISTLKEG